MGETPGFDKWVDKNSWVATTKKHNMANFHLILSDCKRTFVQKKMLVITQADWDFRISGF